MKMPASLCAQCKAVFVVKLSMRGVTACIHRTWACCGVQKFPDRAEQERRLENGSPNMRT